MAIPGLDTRDDVPPPLPPPRILPFGDAPTHLPDDMKRERREYTTTTTSLSSLASGYSSMSPSYLEERPCFKRRDTGSINGDEGYASYASTERCAIYYMWTPRHSINGRQRPHASCVLVPQSTYNH